MTFVGGCSRQEKDMIRINTLNLRNPFLTGPGLLRACYLGELRNEENNAPSAPPPTTAAIFERDNRSGCSRWCFWGSRQLVVSKTSDPFLLSPYPKHHTVLGSILGALFLETPLSASRAPIASK